MPDRQPRQILDADVLNRIARLELRARNVVEGTISGRHRSPYNGFSVEFATHREYVPGDDIKHVDWKVWGRADRLFIKQYEEETNLRCHVLLDCSRSMRYGEAGDGPSKFECGCTLAASLCYLLQRQQDAAGLVTFDTETRHTLPPSSHPGHLRAILQTLGQVEPDHHTDVSDVFHRLAEAIGRRGLVVLISDCFTDTETLARALRHFRHRRHEVIVFQIMHADELDFPFKDNTLFRGMEDDVRLLTEPRALRKSYLASVERFLGRVRRACANAGIDYMLVSTHDPLDAALASYLAFRQRASVVVARRAGGR